MIVQFLTEFWDEKLFTHPVLLYKECQNCVRKIQNVRGHHKVESSVSADKELSVFQCFKQCRYTLYLHILQREKPQADSRLWPNSRKNTISCKPMCVSSTTICLMLYIHCSVFIHSSQKSVEVSADVRPHFTSARRTCFSEGNLATSWMVNSPQYISWFTLQTCLPHRAQHTELLSFAVPGQTSNGSIETI